MTDPDTGFTYNVYWNNYTNSSKRNNFLSKLIDFRFDKERKLFRLVCNGSVLGTDAGSEYELYSHGNRIIYTKDEQLLTDATDYIRRMIENAGITNIDENLLKQEDASKINAVFGAVRILLQMRNSGVVNGKTKNFVVSPMMNENGEFYETGMENNCEVMLKNHLAAYM